MGLFSFLNRKSGYSPQGTGAPGASAALPLAQGQSYADKTTARESGGEAAQGSFHGIHVLFQFLESNHEARGFDDALVNPDTTNLQQNIEALKNDLGRTIRKVKIFYEDFIRETDFHISSRSRSGMVDTVEELTMKKQMAEQHIRQVTEIEEQAKNNEGPGQGIIISYTRGFRNGLAAISHHSILRKNL